MLTREKKKQRNEHIDDEGTWAISYGDMVTLLLAFFVLFFTLDPEKEKQELLQQSLLVSLAERSPNNLFRKPNSLHIGQEESSNNIDEKLVNDWGATVHQVGQRIIVDFPGVSFFEIGNTRLNLQGQKRLATFVKKYLPFSGSYTLGIRAFTDSRPVLSKSLVYRDNLELSALRAVSTMRHLRRLGIPIERMQLGGYGELNAAELKLKSLAKQKGLTDELALARKVILVIEPETKEVQI